MEGIEKTKRYIVYLFYAILSILPLLFVFDFIKKSFAYFSWRLFSRKVELSFNEVLDAYGNGNVYLIWFTLILISRFLIIKFCVRTHVYKPFFLITATILPIMVIPWLLFEVAARYAVEKKDYYD